MGTNLEEMFENKSIILMWAWASRDYWFPLWEWLKRLLIEELENNKLEGFQNKEFDKFWIKTIQDHPDDTIDYMIYHYSSSQESADYILWIVSLVIVKIEEIDKNRNHIWWIEEFKALHLQYLLTGVIKKWWSADKLRQMIWNISFITLNYDRVFEYHFWKSLMSEFKESLAKAWINYSEITRFSNSFNQFSYHPHGSVWTRSVNEDWDIKWLFSSFTYRNPSSHAVTPYWEKNNVEKCLKNGNIFIWAVDECKEIDQTYRKVNSILSRTQNIYILWISPIWISQSRYKLPESAKYHIFSSKKWFDESVLPGEEIIDHKTYCDWFIDFLKK